MLRSVGNRFIPDKDALKQIGWLGKERKLRKSHKKTFINAKSNIKSI